MLAAAYVWVKVLGILENRLGAVTVSAMLDDAEPVELNDTTLVIYSPSDFRQEAIRRALKEHIEQILRKELSLPVRLEVWGDEELKKHRQHPGDSHGWHYRPQFDFSSFVAGVSNQVPLKAAQQVADHPGETVYNPLYLYGPPGVGKTHLLCAIANRVLQLHPQINIVCIKGDQFTNELIQAIMNHTTADFKEKYRNADILLVDDIQFIAGKESTQEEFFHTFNYLHEFGKQIVLTSDRVPNQIPTLEDRLQSRFGAGAMIRMEPPDMQTRALIIRAKAEALALPLNDEIVDFLAGSLCDNVRQIEGGLRKIRAFKELSGMQLNLENIRRILADVQTSETAAVMTPDLIIRYVCRYYGVEESQLKSRLRGKNISEPRQVAIYLIRQMTKCSLEDIGKYFGRDHSTVKYALSAIQNASSLPGSNMEQKLREIRQSIETNS